ncbi:NAD(P)/FAD-dependent oxidoreductase [Psychroserpens sp. BH13MA-6]
MNKVDYIVVGCGLAGIAFCEQLRMARKSFIVFDNQSQQSSRVAAGLFNPVILKRFTKVWNASSQLSLMRPKYDALEGLLKEKFIHDVPIYRKFASIQEQNEWFVAADKPILSEFLSLNLKQNSNPSIKAEFGFGEVLETGRVHTSLLVASYKKFLKETHRLVESSFNHDELKIAVNTITYQNIEAGQIVFAEGFGLVQNPFFKYLPLNGTKGEMLTIKAPTLQLDVILKSSVFVVPLGSDLYWVGATYERDDKTHTVTEMAKEALLSKLKDIIKCDFEIVEQVAGIRPTTKDRRPLVGVHSSYKNMSVLNGLGTRGVMISPYVAQQLFNHIEHGSLLDPEIDIKRFKN